MSWFGGGRFTGGMLPVNTPAHNLREVVKELTLLEDHLFHPDKRCGSCIQKHLLKVEALLEEAVSMDEEGKYAEWTAGAAGAVRGLMAAISDGTLTAEETGQIIRQARRALAAGLDF